MISIACRDFEIDCDHVFDGSSLQELVHSVQRHAIDGHDWTRKGVSNPEFVRMLVSVLRQKDGTEDINPVTIAEWLKDAPELTKAPDTTS